MKAAEFGRRICRRQRNHSTAKAIILPVRPHAKIMDMHMRTHRYVLTGHADDLAVFQHRLARCNGADGNLVP